MSRLGESKNFERNGRHVLRSKIEKGNIEAYSKEIIKMIHLLETWCYRKIQISWNERVHEIVENPWKIRFASHVVRCSGIRLTRLVLDSTTEGKREESREQSGAMTLNNCQDSKMEGRKRKVEQRQN